MRSWHRAGREGDRVTLKDVADKAGVSLATASKVMNGRADVRQATRETVAQAARDLGYHPKRRESDRRRSALIHFDTLTSPYSLQVLEGAEQAAHRAGVDLMVISGDQTPSGLSRAWMVEAAARGVEGVILVTTPIGSQHARWSRDLTLPLIAIDPGLHRSRCRWDRHHLGHQLGGWKRCRSTPVGPRAIERIGVLAGPADSVPARQRVQGYHSALGSVGSLSDSTLSSTAASPTRMVSAGRNDC